MVGDRKILRRTGPSSEEDISKFQSIPEKNKRFMDQLEDQIDHFCKITTLDLNHMSYIFRVHVINSICIQKSSVAILVTYMIISYVK